MSGTLRHPARLLKAHQGQLKKHISYISTKEAMKALNGLNPVKFEYKADDSGEEHLGFIAEDVPDLVAEQDHKYLSPIDLTAALTKVVQEQQRMLQEQQETISALSEKVKELEDRI